jgi:hypothetical protein
MFLINSAFVGNIIFILIKMHGKTTIKIFCCRLLRTVFLPHREKETASPLGVTS